MLIITDLKENKYHLSNKPGCEWWYFDGIDDDGDYSFFVTFYVGNPFSPEYNTIIDSALSGGSQKHPDPRDFCCVSIRLFLNGRELYVAMYEYKKNKFSIISDGATEKIFIDKSSFYFDNSLNKYFLNIHLLPADLDKKFKAEFTFSPKLNSGKSIDAESTSEETFHLFPSASGCDFSGKFKFYKNFKRTKTDITGLGYHHHFWSLVPVSENIKDWHFARVISGEYSVIFLNVSYGKSGKADFRKIMIYKNSELIYDTNDFELKIKRSANYLLMLYPSSIRITFADVEIDISRSTILDSGPAHVNYISKSSLIIDKKKVLNRALGLSEFIKLPRTKSGVFRSVMNKKLYREEE